MSWIEFIKDKWLFCVTQSIVVIFIATLLMVFSMNAYGIVFVCMTIVILDMLLLVGEYIQKQLYYKKLLRTLDHLDKKRLISEVLEEPRFDEGKLWWHVIKSATKSMNDEVAYYRLLQEEYKTYIEAWIHEIKTPISCIGLICENHKNEDTQYIAEEIRKIDGFVEQALFYARSTSVEKDYVIKEVNLEGMVRTAIKKHARQMIEHKVQLELGDLDYRVFTDPKWIDFMLGQVISNSLKYKKEILTLKFSARLNETQVVLSIEDNGIGISEQDIGRVFDKGFTGKNGRKYAKSTGIGLYLCKKLSEKMHLGIEVDSEEKKGTTVSIIFPKDKEVFFET